MAEEWLALASVPDESDHRLGYLCGGSVSQATASAVEQTLRLLATQLPAERARFSVEYDFDPSRPMLERLTIRYRAQASSEVLVSQLLAPMKALLPPDDDGETSLSGSSKSSTSESRRNSRRTLRRRLDYAPTEPDVRQANRYIPGRYLSLSAFQPRETPDWSMLDILLDSANQKGKIVVEAQPGDADEFRRGLDHYFRWLGMAAGGSLDAGDPNEFVRRGSQSFRGSSYRDGVADELRWGMRELREAMQSPLLQFKVMVEAPDSVVGILANALGQVALKEGSYQIDSAPGEDVAAQTGKELPRLVFDQKAWEWIERVMQAGRSLATVEELLPFLKPPIATQRRRFRTKRRSTDLFPADDSESGRIRVGLDAEIVDPGVSRSSKPNQIALSLTDFTRHLFVTGMPGSGKTTLVQSILRQLWVEQKVPFLVIESAKTEYRRWLGGVVPHAEQRLFSLGRRSGLPLRFNPLARAPGVTVEEQVLSLLSCFAAAFPSEPVVLMVFEQALREVYDAIPLSRGEPRISDLHAVALDVAEQLGYGAEIRDNLRGALANRLGFLTQGLLGETFDCGLSWPGLSDLMSHPTVIELDALSPERGCLVGLLLLNAMRQVLKHGSSDPASRPLRHVSVIEEAHNIVGAGKAPTTDGPDSQATASEFVTRMLAEVRALGEGLIIVDQLPSAVAPEVIKNTGTKIAGRLDNEDDRRVIADGMLLGEPEEQELARLEVQHCFVYTAGMYRGRRVFKQEEPSGRQVAASGERPVELDSQLFDYARTELRNLGSTLGAATESLYQNIPRYLLATRERWEPSLASVLETGYRELTEGVNLWRRMYPGLVSNIAWHCSFGDPTSLVRSIGEDLAVIVCGTLVNAQAMLASLDELAFGGGGQSRNGKRSRARAAAPGSHWRSASLSLPRWLAMVLAQELNLQRMEALKRHAALVDARFPQDESTEDFFRFPLRLDLGERRIAILTSGPGMVFPPWRMAEQAFNPERRREMVRAARLQLRYRFHEILTTSG